MNLLRFYFMVGGETLDAEAFGGAAAAAGFAGGRIRTINNRKQLVSAKDGARKLVEVFPGMTGTSGTGFQLWMSALVNYAVDKKELQRLRNLGICTEAAQIWLREEAVLLEFLDKIRENLPAVRQYCSSDYFQVLKLVYGYDEGDAPGGGFHFSENLIAALGLVGAGLSSDSEPYELHFTRLTS